MKFTNKMFSKPGYKHGDKLGFALCIFSVKKAQVNLCLRGSINCDFISCQSYLCGTADYP